MAEIIVSCTLCGQPMAVETALDIPATAVLAVCHDCGRDELRAGGGVILHLPADVPDAAFSVEEIQVTGGAIALLEAAGQHVGEFLARHMRGDWGTAGQVETITVTEHERRHGAAVTDDAGKLNKVALETGSGRIMSIYPMATGEELWIFTELPTGATTVLDSDEY